LLRRQSSASKAGKDGEPHRTICNLSANHKRKYPFQRSVGRLSEDNQDGARTESALQWHRRNEMCKSHWKGNNCNSKKKKNKNRQIPIRHPNVKWEKPREDKWVKKRSFSNEGRARCPQVLLSKAGRDRAPGVMHPSLK